MNFFPKTLFWRIYLVVFAALLVSVFLISLYVEALFKETHRNDVEKHLLIEANLVAEHIYLTQSLTPSNLVDVSKRLKNITDSRITIIKSDGVVLADSDEDASRMDNHRGRPEVVAALEMQYGVSIRYSDTVKRNMMYVAVKKELMGEPLIIRVAIPFSFIKLDLRSFYNHIIVAALIVLLVITIATYLILRWVTSPLDEITERASLIARGVFQPSIRQFNCNEIDRLSDTLNAMANQLETQFNTLKQQKEELEKLLYVMAEGIIVIDNNQKIVRINPSASLFFNIPPERALGRNIVEIMRNPNLQTFARDALHCKEIMEEEVTIYGKPDRYLQLHGISLKDNNGKENGALIVFSDISKVKRLETIRKDFVANVSHELKTPITSLKGCVETLSETFAELKNIKGLESLFEILKRNISRMEAIVNDLLTLAKVEFDMEHHTINKKRERLIDIIASSIRHFQELANKKRINVVNKSQSDLFADVNASLLQQAVDNLLDNAIKYSPEKTTVTIETQIADREIEIRIKDEGPGIPSQHLDRIFERFYRIDKARSRALGGTGLGLSIVKNIALAHGGRVSVQSKIGEGSTFILHLPKNLS